MGEAEGGVEVAGEGDEEDEGEFAEGVGAEVGAGVGTGVVGAGAGDFGTGAGARVVGEGAGDGDVLGDGAGDGGDETGEGGVAVGSGTGAWAKHELAKRLEIMKTWRNRAKSIFIIIFKNERKLLSFSVLVTWVQSMGVKIGEAERGWVTENYGEERVLKLKYQDCCLFCIHCTSYL